MKTDLYTKAVLTVIAACLVVLVARESAQSVQATFLDRGEPVIKVQIVSIDEAPTLRWESIPVCVVPPDPPGIPSDAVLRPWASPDKTDVPPKSAPRCPGR